MVSLMATKKKPPPRGRPPGPQKRRVVLKLPPELDNALYAAAGRVGLTKSAYVERAVQEKLERER
jgi:hypothetical protein